jgi:heme-degrading monooxygenase HmoA
MLAVIFEVWPADDARREQYLLAIDGFISIERFQSMNEPGKLLSLSFWRDEEAVQAWRNLPAHRAAQSKGRESVFEDYRLRVAHVLRDYGLDNRDEIPADSRDVHSV